MTTAKMPNSRLQNSSPQTNGWRHGDYIHFLYTVYGRDLLLKYRFCDAANV